MVSQLALLLKSKLSFFNGIMVLNRERLNNHLKPFLLEIMSLFSLLGTLEYLFFEVRGSALEIIVIYLGR
jgi:hypothetical protein